MRLRHATAVLCAVVLLAGGAAHADKPVAINARVSLVGENRYQFEVNIVHEDDSWDHFVDRWEVIGNGGKVIATDNLFYPRIGQDFVYRVLRGVKVEAGTEFVTYRLHDVRHGFGREKLIRMPTAAKPDTGWH
jgi:hypothetical protein